MATCGPTSSRSISPSRRARRRQRERGGAATSSSPTTPCSCSARSPILQPFPQLDRAVHRVAESERAATEVLRFAKRPLARAQIDALLRRGFIASAPHHPAGSALGKPLPSGRRLCLWVEPALFSARPVFQLERVWFEAAVDAGDRLVPIGAMDPIEYSEAVIELDELVA